ncbi:hypothetical protein GPA22_22280 [Aromatoleum toluvorans]|uniref:Uncharacterized protein n=1 Tax=Aromatoleum toluvorans TaxID=92002 RepID=A0ABX1Q3Z7_9RHOO|nr:hypothetical protein [Aromatoleum toluvorans]NMG46443.1 hypothetical protein [Aromatoleum toluvorans]
MASALKHLVRALLCVPAVALASSAAFDVQTTSTSVVIKNTTSDSYMEMLINVGGCGKKVMAGPGRVVTVPTEGARRDVEVKSVKLTPMRQLRTEANLNPQPVPQPVTDPKILASMRPVCLDLK